MERENSPHQADSQLPPPLIGLYGVAREDLENISHLENEGVDGHFDCEGCEVVK